MNSFYLNNLRTKEDLLKIICEKWGFEYIPNFPIPVVPENQFLISCELLARYSEFNILFFILNIPSVVSNKNFTI